MRNNASLYRKSPLRRRGTAVCLNWRWFCINFWPPRNTGAVGTEMIDNYYYLRQEYTPDIEVPRGRGDIIRGSIKPHRGGFAYSQRARLAVPPSDSSHRANYLITTAGQSSEFIESSLFSRASLWRVRAAGSYWILCVFQFLGHDESPVGSYLATDILVSWLVLSPDGSLRNIPSCGEPGFTYIIFH